MTYHLSRPIVIQAYDPQWAGMYAREEQLLRGILTDCAVQIEHIGSTSVPGLAAKAIIDISVAVRDLVEVTPFIPALAEKGYEEVPINPVFQRRLFSKGPYNEGSHHVHFTVHGSLVWAEPLLFRDYLRSHPEAAAWYQQVKRDAATNHQTDLNGYHDEKAGCVITLMAQARAWQAEE
ncbi:MAG: GrpB family protein [Caldilineaceae bacterium]